MPRLLCWFLHRRSWTILIPGALPAHLDAVAWCPACDGGGGHRARPRRLPYFNKVQPTWG
ncbi:MAG: hypothetical protein J2P45_14920 [Candidatus Dormibacteraeota bacterium]|nr:hypothetical protein [Candidatus Dormibacteraeota bacterium]